MAERFSFARVGAVLMKEFVQMRRDRLTLAMILGVPVMQLLLFGFAINLDPKHLPTAISADDSGRFTRALVASLENSDYFDVIKTTTSPEEARELLAKGDVNFVVEIPVDFSRNLTRGQQPQLLVDVDATDPASGTNAIGTFALLTQTAFKDDLVGTLAARAPPTPAYQIVIHRRYNPEINTQYSIVPGLLGVILTMTMVLLTSMAVTRERERGTYENLLAMPTTPVEIMLGKILPNIVVGLIQSVIILLAAKYIFAVPMLGSFVLLYGALTIFIAVNLAVGYTFSTIAAEPAPGDADDGVLPPAVDPAVGFRLPLPGDAQLGAMVRRVHPGDTFHPRRPRHPPQGQRLHGDLAGRLAAHSRSVHGGYDRPSALPPHSMIAD